jgi:hypothetical protein
MFKLCNVLYAAEVIDNGEKNAEYFLFDECFLSLYAKYGTLQYPVPMVIKIPFKKNKRGGNE